MKLNCKLFIGILAMLGLCGSLYAQMIMPRVDESNSVFCKNHCQPNESGFCTIYIVDNEGGEGMYTCGQGVIIYDSEEEQPND